jgi:peroxiredoxin Q/BCP
MHLGRFGLIAALVGMSTFAFAATIDIGPPVGSVAPHLKAVDTAGKAVTLKEITGQSGVVLAFVRSADWCPYCQKQLIGLQEAQLPLARRGYTLAALSYDSPGVLVTFARRREIGYMLLSDEKSEMIDAFGIRDPQYPPGSKEHGVPMPGIFIIDAKGVIQAKLAEEGYKTRPPVAAVIEAVDRLAPGKARK